MAFSLGTCLISSRSSLLPTRKRKAYSCAFSLTSRTQLFRALKLSILRHFIVLLVDGVNQEGCSNSLVKTPNYGFECFLTCLPQTVTYRVPHLQHDRCLFVDFNSLGVELDSDSHIVLSRELAFDVLKEHAGLSDV